jgi:hypothetical protein
MLAKGGEGDYRVYRLVLYQFMWNVKRKMFGLEALDHIVPYFYSPQGCGKSTLIGKIAAPFKELYNETDIEKLTERFANRILENYYIVHLEESAKAGKSPIETVKSLITQSHTANRDMHSQVAKRRRVNISPIISSNNPLKQMFKDFTGMRRFYEIKHGMLDFDVVNSLDYVAMWQGVDETKDESPFRRNPHIYDIIIQDQSEHRSMNTVEIFLTEMGFLPCKPSDSVWYTGRDIFTKFRRWAEDNCDRKADIQMFNTQIGYLYPTVMSKKGERDILYRLHRDGGSAKMIDPNNDFAAADGGQGFEELE